MNLPEILTLILLELPYHEVLMKRSVCSQWNQITRNQYFWCGKLKYDYKIDLMRSDSFYREYVLLRAKEAGLYPNEKGAYRAAKRGAIDVLECFEQSTPAILPDSMAANQVAVYSKDPFIVLTWLAKRGILPTEWTLQSLYDEPDNPVVIWLKRHLEH